MNQLKMLRRLVTSVALAAGLLSSNAAQAGIPVIDVASLTQAIQQVIAWGQQYGQMTDQYQQLVQQYQQAVQQYNALTGTRNLGNVLNNPALQHAVPDGTALMSVYSAVNTRGFAGLSDTAQALRNATAVYDCSGRAGDALRL